MRKEASGLGKTVKGIEKARKSQGFFSRLFKGPNVEVLPGEENFYRGWNRMGGKKLEALWKEDVPMEATDAGVPTLLRDRFGIPLDSVEQEARIKGEVMKNTQLWDDAAARESEEIDVLGLPKYYENVSALKAAKGKAEAARDAYYKIPVEEGMIRDPDYVNDFDTRVYLANKDLNKALNSLNRVERQHPSLLQIRAEKNEAEKALEALQEDADKYRQMNILKREFTSTPLYGEYVPVQYRATFAKLGITPEQIEEVNKVMPGYTRMRDEYAARQHLIPQILNRMRVRRRNGLILGGATAIGTGAYYAPQLYDAGRKWIEDQSSSSPSAPTPSSSPTPEIDMSGMGDEATGTTDNIIITG